MKKIVLILPYFGKWPLWFDAHLLSIAQNPTIHWLVVTDCEIPKDYPKNIIFKPTTLQALNTHVNQVVNANVPLSPRKFCDLKPAYGAIFYEDIKEYDFWGFCDMDIIWGNIRKFITDEILSNYDIISSRKEAISGHFNLIKNTTALNNLYKQIPNYQYLFEQPKFMWFDEAQLTNYLKNQIANKQLPYQVKWDTILCNQERGRDSWQGYYLDKWFWEKGNLFELDKNYKKKSEVMYLHFISWKRKMKKCIIKYNEHPEQFYISFDGIQTKKNSKLKIVINDLINVFYGFWFRERMKVASKKYKKVFKRKFQFLINGK